MGSHRATPGPLQGDTRPARRLLWKQFQEEPANLKLRSRGPGDAVAAAQGLAGCRRHEDRGQEAIWCQDQPRGAEQQPRLACPGIAVSNKQMNGLKGVSFDFAQSSRRISEHPPPTVKRNAYRFK